VRPKPSKFHPESIEPKIKSLRAVVTEEIEKYGGQVASFDYIIHLATPNLYWASLSTTYDAHEFQSMLSVEMLSQIVAYKSFSDIRILTPNIVHS